MASEHHAPDSSEGEVIPAGRSPRRRTRQLPHTMKSSSVSFLSWRLMQVPLILLLSSNTIHPFVVALTLPSAITTRSSTLSTIPTIPIQQSLSISTTPSCASPSSTPSTVTVTLEDAFDFDYSNRNPSLFHASSSSTSPLTSKRRRLFGIHWDDDNHHHVTTAERPNSDIEAARNLTETKMNDQIVVYEEKQHPILLIDSTNPVLSDEWSMVLKRAIPKPCGACMLLSSRTARIPSLLQRSRPSPLAPRSNTIRISGGFAGGQAHLLQKPSSTSDRRGVLGFQIDDQIDEDSSFSPSSSTSSSSISKRKQRTGKSSALLASARTTKVNSVVWNKKNLELTSFASSPSPSSSSSASVTASPYGTTSTTNLLWFPWIPTPTQIKSLSKEELEQACLERGIEVLPGVDSSTSQRDVEQTLQERLWDWTRDQQVKQQRQRLYEQRRWDSVFPTFVSPEEDQRSNIRQRPPSQRPRVAWTEQTTRRERDPIDKKVTTSDSASRKHTSSSSSSPNSLAEWARTVDLKPLLSRREKIRQQKFDPTLPTTSSSTTTHRRANHDRKRSKHEKNGKLTELYDAAKAADQSGDLALSKNLLVQLKEACPEDARVYRRLARIETAQGKVADAVAILQEGLRLHPRNSYLWHGLAGVTADNREKKRCWNRAIQLDPSFPHPYHALGTMEHAHGRVASAMKILKQGVKNCPLNHRVHHALGDLYRDAKMLDMAERSYLNALKHGPPVSHGFAYTALAYVSYERGEVDKCRKWLMRALKLNNGRQANAWLALAQMEEAEGNTDAARSVSIAGISLYERGLLERQTKLGMKNGIVVPGEHVPFTKDPVKMKNKLLRAVPHYRSGDRFYNVYRNWGRLEERYGTVESVEEVYDRAMAAFPLEWRLYVDLAQYYAKLRKYNQARSFFSEACSKVVHFDASPFRLYATFEMNLGNYKEARRILYRGVATLTQSQFGNMGSGVGLAELYHTWAVCEWHLGELDRAAILFDHALRSTKSSEDSGLRSFILYSIARLHHHRGEELLAQHCIGLCLAENLMPGGNSKIWDLWSEVADSLGNMKLASECRSHAEQSRTHESENGTTAFSRLLVMENAVGSSSGLSRMKGQGEMERHMRRDPWYHKIFGPPVDQRSDFFDSLTFPDVN